MYKNKKSREQKRKQLDNLIKKLNKIVKRAAEKIDRYSDRKKK